MANYWYRNPGLQAETHTPSWSSFSLCQIALRGCLLVITAYGLFTETAAAMTQKALTQSVAEGHRLFINDGFFSANMVHGQPETCATCHLNGGLSRGRLLDKRSIPSLVNAIAIFPRYSAKLHKVITLQTQIRVCVNSGLGGMPPAYGGERMTAIISYLGSLAHGQTVDIGGAKH